jgi:hypothetical protein
MRSYLAMLPALALLGGLGCAHSKRCEPNAAPAAAPATPPPEAGAAVASGTASGAGVATVASRGEGRDSARAQPANCRR